MSLVRVLVVEDYDLFRSFICSTLGERAELQLVGEVADGLEAVQKAKELQPDLILMDLSLPGMNGIEATRQIRILSSGSRILFLSEHADSSLIQAALDAGACGYILKSDSGSDLIVGIRAVLLGQLFVSRSLTNWRENSDCMD